MVCLGLEPRAAERKAQPNPLSYGGTPLKNICLPIDNCIKNTKLKKKLMANSSSLQSDFSPLMHESVKWCKFVNRKFY